MTTAHQKDHHDHGYRHHHHRHYYWDHHHHCWDYYWDSDYAWRRPPPTGNVIQVT
ncbi:hypothetical protein AB0478_12740 [Streptomyces sp. NPDC051917]|uniref:hypothetical protein n=1 Tax=Streptomyces sp. NPDC051917 TaxID=3154754 RepID=UPI00344E6531